MTVKEIDGLLQVKDEKGDVNTIYPVTKAEMGKFRQTSCRRWIIFRLPAER